MVTTQKQHTKTITNNKHKKNRKKETYKTSQTTNKETKTMTNKKYHKQKISQTKNITNKKATY